MLEIKRLNFVGLSISDINSRLELTDYVNTIVKKGLSKILYGHSLWTITIIVKTPEVIEYGEKADILVTDGHPYYWLAKAHGLPLKYEISIPQLVLLTLDLADKNGWSVFLFGATSEINQKATENIKIEYNGIKEIKGSSGFFQSDKLDDITKEISARSPNVLLIGMPSPFKEKYATIMRDRGAANIIIPCGGMIDVLGGKNKMTPPVLKKLGLATIYRLLQEPKRLFRETIHTYSFVFFNFIPSYLFHVVILRKKNFSVYDHYGR